MDNLILKLDLLTDMVKCDEITESGLIKELELLIRTEKRFATFINTYKK